MPDECVSCHKDLSHISSIFTDGDGFNDAQYVGIVKPPFKSYCWDCYKAGKAPNFNKQIDEAFAAVGMCGFLEAWIGRCRNPKPCKKHASQKCWKCGEQAIRNCAETGVLVCGMPECKDHPHSEHHHGFGGI